LLPQTLKPGYGPGRGDGKIAINWQESVTDDVFCSLYFENGRKFREPEEEMRHNQPKMFYLRLCQSSMQCLLATTVVSIFICANTTFVAATRGWKNLILLSARERSRFVSLQTHKCAHGFSPDLTAAFLTFS